MADTPALTRRSPEDLRVLAAACDMAVLRALELVGKRVARDGRSRYGAMKKSGRARRRPPCPGRGASSRGSRRSTGAAPWWSLT